MPKIEPESLKIKAWIDRQLRQPWKSRTKQQWHLLEQAFEMRRVALIIERSSRWREGV